jgi:hypothetical protein
LQYGNFDHIGVWLRRYAATSADADKFIDGLRKAGLAE